MTFYFRSTFVLCLSVILSLSTALDKDGTCPAPTTTGQVTGFAVFTARPEDANAYIQDFRPLIANTRAEPGNVHYAMYTNPSQPGVIGFTERYSDMAALQAHLSNKHVTDIFQHEYYTTLRSEPPKLFGPWFEVAPEGCGEEDDEIEMVFYWNMNCTKQHIWNIITDWKDASWVKDVVKTTIVPLRDDGTVMSEEEANAVGDLQVNRGLGNVVQRRTFSNGFNLDVKMLQRNDDTFVTVQETISPLVFPGVKFGKFYVTISLHSDGLDEEVETRLRYHVRATVLEGTKQLARETLKNDFYGPRIKFYQEYFNCSVAVNMKTAQNTIDNLHRALQGNDRQALLSDLFTDQNEADDYVKSTFRTHSIQDDTRVQVFTPVKPVIAPDLRAMVVEDLVLHSIGATNVQNRITLYQLDEWGRVKSAKIFDTLPTNCGKTESSKVSYVKSWLSKPFGAILAFAETPCLEAELVDATNRYYEVLKSRNLDKIRKLYADNRELHDPVGFQKSRTFESVYNNFITILESFVYKRYPTRTFVDVESRKTIQLVDASFKGRNGLGEFTAQPIQVLTFDNELKIEKFEAFFVPRVVDFSKLK